MSDENEGATATTWVREDVALTAVEALDREYKLRRQDRERAHGRAIARIWAPIVCLVAVSLLTLIGFVVHQISTEHAGQIHVYCDDDQHNDQWEREYVGSPANVTDACRNGA